MSKKVDVKQAAEFASKICEVSLLYGCSLYWLDAFAVVLSLTQIDTPAWTKTLDVFLKQVYKVDECRQEYNKIYYRSSRTVKRLMKWLVKQARK